MIFESALSGHPTFWSQDAQQQIFLYEKLCVWLFIMLFISVGDHREKNY